MEWSYPLSHLSKAITQGLDRWFSSLEHMLLLQRCWVQFLVPTWWFRTISNSRGPVILFGPPLYQGYTPVYIFTCQETLIHLNIQINPKKIHMLLIQPLWKAVGTLLKEINIESAHNPAIPL